MREDGLQYGQDWINARSGDSPLQLLLCQYSPAFEKSSRFRYWAARLHAPEWGQKLDTMRDTCAGEGLSLGWEAGLRPPVYEPLSLHLEIRQFNIEYEKSVQNLPVLMVEQGGHAVCGGQLNFAYPLDSEIPCHFFCSAGWSNYPGDLEPPR